MDNLQREKDRLSYKKMSGFCFGNEKFYINRKYYKNIRLEESKLGADKVKLARKQYRGKGQYIDEILV